MELSRSARRPTTARISARRVSRCNALRLSACDGRRSSPRAQAFERDDVAKPMAQVPRPGSPVGWSRSLPGLRAGHRRTLGVRKLRPKSKTRCSLLGLLTLTSSRFRLSAAKASICTFTNNNRGIRQGRKHEMLLKFASMAPSDRECDLRHHPSELRPAAS